MLHIYCHIELWSVFNAYDCDNLATLLINTTHHFDANSWITILCEDNHEDDDESLECSLITNRVHHCGGSPRRSHTSHWCEYWTATLVIPQWLSHNSYPTIVIPQ